MRALLCMSMLGLTAGLVSAREGDVLAPGVLWVTALSADGRLAVNLLERSYRGTWTAVRDLRELPLLGLHWRAGKESGTQGQWARAELRDDLGLAMQCEFAILDGVATGVCEDPGGRLFYLRP